MKKQKATNRTLQELQTLRTTKESIRRTRPKAKTLEDQESTGSKPKARVRKPKTSNASSAKLKTTAVAKTPSEKALDSQISSVAEKREEYNKLLATLDTGDPRSDTFSLDFLRIMLADTLQLIPEAHAEYHRTHSTYASYAYNGLVAQARDLASDLRAYKSIDQTIEYIDDNILKNMLREVFSQMTVGVSRLKENANAVTPTECHKELEEHINQYLKEAADIMSQVMLKSSKRLREYFIAS